MDYATAITRFMIEPIGLVHERLRAHAVNPAAFKDLDRGLEEQAAETRRILEEHQFDEDAARAQLCRNFLRYLWGALGGDIPREHGLIYLSKLDRAHGHAPGVAAMEFSLAKRSMKPGQDFMEIGDEVLVTRQAYAKHLLPQWADELSRRVLYALGEATRGY